MLSLIFLLFIGVTTSLAVNALIAYWALRLNLWMIFTLWYGYATYASFVAMTAASQHDQALLYWFVYTKEVAACIGTYLGGMFCAAYFDAQTR